MARILVLHILAVGVWFWSRSCSQVGLVNWAALQDTKPCSFESEFQTLYFYLAQQLCKTHSQPLDEHEVSRGLEPKNSKTRPRLRD